MSPIGQEMVPLAPTAGVVQVMPGELIETKVV